MSPTYESCKVHLAAPWFYFIQLFTVTSTYLQLYLPLSDLTSLLILPFLLSFSVYTNVMVLSTPSPECFKCGLASLEQKQ